MSNIFWTDIAFFIFGFASGIMALFTYALAKTKEEEKGKAARSRRWTSIENVKFVWNFDYKFTDPTSMKEIAGHIPAMMVRQIDKMEDDPIVEPGSYSVDLTVNARFVGRDDADTPRSSNG